MTTPIVALHGAGGSPQDWSATAAQINQHWQLVPLDITGPWEWETVLDRLEADIERLGLDNPLMIGTSLGGMIAALWARRHPECPGVITLDGHGVPTQSFRYRPEERAQLGERLNALRGFFAQFGQPELQRAMEELDCLAVFEEIACPLLVVVATEPLPGNDLFDAYMRGLRHDLHTVAAAHPNVEVVWHPTTHAMISEDPGGVAELVEGFLTRA